MIAVVVVRDGALPLGADECVAEAGGRALLVGTSTSTAAKDLTSRVRVTDVRAAEVDGGFAPGAWAGAIAPLVAGDDVVVLPASADGRDLAPRLAFALDRPLLAGAVLVAPGRVVVVRDGGLVAEEHDVTQPFVATLEPGVRGVEPAGAGAPAPTPLDVVVTPGRDVEVVDVLPPDPATMDLSEAPRIVAGGAGLQSPDAFAALRRVAAALGASYGASRVAADAGWVPHDRFIGTTGAAVHPKLYVAFGISGAVQHVSGLGDPEHIVSVNTDRSCPMMSMADLAIVADARATLDALARTLDAEVGTGG